MKKFKTIGSMEKLELKHLTPYFPYKLKFISQMDKPYDEFGKNPIWTFDGIIEIFGDYCMTTKEKSDAYPVKQCKPILRPLSDITKHREDFGFVPMDVLNELYRETDLLYFDVNNLMKQPYNRIQKIFEWHFDVFGLIEKDLAIDINTLVA